MTDMIINDCSCFETGVCSCQDSLCACECGCNECDEIMMNNIQMSMSGCACGGNCGCSGEADEEEVLEIELEDELQQC